MIHAWMLADMFSSLSRCTALMEVGSERRGRTDCREMHAMILFMWQDDIIGAARFIDARLERVSTSAGPPVGDQASDAALSWLIKRCNDSSSSSCTCRMLRTSIHQQHPEAAPSLASKDSRRGSVADSAGGRAPRKSTMRQPRDSGAFLYSLPAALRLPMTDTPGFSFCSWAGCTRHEMHVDARHAQLHVDSDMTSERLQARRLPHDHQSRALCYLAAGMIVCALCCRGTQHGQGEPGCSGGDQRRQRRDIQGRCAQVGQVFLWSAAQRQSRRLNCKLPGGAAPWADLLYHCEREKWFGTPGNGITDDLLHFCIADGAKEGNLACYESVCVKGMLLLSRA